MDTDDIRDRLTAWFARQLPEATDVEIDGLDRVEFGHSAEMLALGLAWSEGGVGRHRDVVLRIRPPEPGLLEPYDLGRQFRVLEALEPTPVRAPAALWCEPSTAVLGRPFFAMERLDGTVYEQEVPAEADDDPQLIRRMCENLVDQIAEIHLVDLDATGLRSLGEGDRYLAEELDRWEREVRRVQKGPLPALERLLAELRAQQPEPTPRVTLVHGDAKPGNFAFVGSEVTAVFDWELTGVGDPLSDIGYLEVLWQMPVGITNHPAAPTTDEIVARYQDRTGIVVHDRASYRAFQVFKLGAIQLIGSMLCDDGHWNDPRAIGMAMGIELMTPLGLRDLGVDEELGMGPIYPREERLAALAAGPASRT